jgi:2-desacetyl-2-hydroxyethyl bacteriochlorophyllide A dehydrogenase
VTDTPATPAPSGSASVVRIAAPKQVELVAAPPLVAGPGEVRVRTLYSGVSAGTELTTYLGTNPYLHRHWDPERRLFTDGPSTAPYPVSGFGYGEVGEIVETGPGVDDLRPGQVVWGIWGHRSDGVLPAATAARQLLPPDTPATAGVFARVGAVALNAVVEADIHVGETVAVFGQGVIGLLATALAKLSGATVVAVDTRPERLELARAFGADDVIDATRESAAEVVRGLTDDRGADVCIELSGTYPALQEAVRTCAYSSRVVASGFYQGAGTALLLGEEFHHNRIELICSQISGPPPRWAHRWTRERLHRGFMELVTGGRLDPLPLITDVVAADQVQDAFAALAAGAAGTLQVVLDFTAAAVPTEEQS